MANKIELERKWAEAKKRYKLSVEHVRMARALGLNPGKLGKIANHKQEPWKSPLPEFIEEIYAKRFHSKPTRSQPTELDIFGEG